MENCILNGELGIGRRFWSRLEKFLVEIKI